MYHPLSKAHLYSAIRINAFFDDYGNEKAMVGTGFIVQSLKSSLFLITNRHVLEASYSDMNKSHWRLTGLTLSGFCEGEFYPYRIRLAGIHPILPESEGEDVAVIRLTYLHYDGECPGKVISIKSNYIATKEDIEQIQISDVVAFPVYHGQAEMPVMRSGWIASDPIKDFSTAGLLDNARRIAVEAFSWQGYSGSPVFTLDHGLQAGAGLVYGGHFRRSKLLGVNAGHIKTTDGSGYHSGLSYLVKGICINEILDSI